MQEPNLERIKAGDEDALRQLFEILLPRIRLMARAHSVGTEEVEDIVQETLIKIYSNLHKFAGDPDHFLAWCRVISRNVALDTRRKHRFTNEVNLDDVGEEELPTFVPKATIDSRSVLEEAIQLLPEQQKLIVLGTIEGRSLSEIAEELSIHPATAARRYHSALKTLNTLMLQGQSASEEIG